MSQGSKCLHCHPSPAHGRNFFHKNVLQGESFPWRCPKEAETPWEAWTGAGSWVSMERVIPELEKNLGMPSTPGRSPWHRNLFLNLFCSDLPQSWWDLSRQNPSRVFQGKITLQEISKRTLLQNCRTKTFPRQNCLNSPPCSFRRGTEH